MKMEDILEDAIKELMKIKRYDTVADMLERTKTTFSKYEQYKEELKCNIQLNKQEYIYKEQI